MRTTCQFCGEVVSGTRDDLYDILRDHWKEQCAVHPVYGSNARASRKDEDEDD